MSMSRRCDIQKANDQKWYLTLGNFEYAHEDHDCTVYGPFESRELLERELDRHSNPGGISMDPSGDRMPPKVSTRTPFVTVRHYR